MGCVTQSRAEGSPHQELSEPLSFGESLAKLERLSAQTLHATSTRIRAELGGAEWKLGLCLLASVRQNRFRQLGYANITQYAEEALHLSGKKAGCLLAIARTLEHLPLCSAAYRKSEIDWCKLRALRPVLTPETEKVWLDFALCHRTNEVEKKVAMAPNIWKRQGAMDASLAGEPIATAESVTDLLENQSDDQGPQAEASVHQPADAHWKEPDATSTGTMTSSVVDSHTADAEPFDVTGKSTESSEAIDHLEALDAEKPPSAPSFLPVAPRVIRMVVDFTPDQFALYESAESRLRGQAGKRIPRAEVLARMAQIVLDSGTARSRSKYQILVHTDSTMETGWYDTERGPLPVSKEVLEQIKADKKLSLAPPIVEPEVQVEVPDEPPESNLSKSQTLTHMPPASTTGKTGRVDVPNWMIRAVLVRAGYRCERCGQRGSPLDLHHKEPVCEGGRNEVEKLEALCKSCHSFEHETDYASKPTWQRARHMAQQTRTSHRDQRVDDG